MKKKIIIISVCCVVMIVIAIFSIRFFTKKDENRRKYQVEKKELTTIRKTVKIEIKRYEKALFSLDTIEVATHENPSPETAGKGSWQNDKFAAGIEKLSHQYPENLIAKDSWKDENMVRQLKRYLQDPLVKNVYSEVMKAYPDLNDITAELEDGISYYLFYYPNEKVPQFYTLVPVFDLEMPSVYGFEDGVFINLDMYLGSKSKYYKEIGLPKYISDRCEKKYIVIDCFKKALVYKLLPRQTKITLLDHMIEEGKKLYFTELMLPSQLEEDIIGYATEKFAWATRFQADVWAYIIEKNLLYSKDSDPVRKFVDEAPHTKPFGAPSPGRMGTFIGWKIVQAYMENNPKVTLSQLMKESDSQKILNLSKYKPVLK